MTETTIPSPSPSPPSGGHLPEIHLQAGRSTRLRRGHPWGFSNEIDMTAAAKALPPGSLVTVVDAGGERLGVGTFNPHSLIAARLLSRNANRAIDAGFLADRLRRAAALRDMLVGRPYYRLVHSEADGLPGLIVDRYGDVLTLQANSAGMDRLLPLLLEACEAVFAPRAVVLRNDSPVRTLEGLALEHRVALGELSGPVEIVENGARFLADLSEGQKTGWFYDQRDNRAFMAGLAAGRRCLDAYTYAGGFAVQMARAGATEVLALDRSEASLDLALKSAELNGLTSVSPLKGEAFGEMERLGKAGERFGVVVADPPAFVKSKKDLASAAKGYRKMARLAASLVDSGGFLFCASCSHHMPVDSFADEIRHGVSQAGRAGRILRSAGAAPDHPLHPWLPESAYLKALVYQLD